MRGAARSKPWNGGLGSEAGVEMTKLYWTGSAFVPVNETAAAKDAARLRQEAPFTGTYALCSQTNRWEIHLGQNGFAAAS